MRSAVRMSYRLLGHDGVTFTWKQLQDLVLQGILTVDTKVIGAGEAFAAPLGARPDGGEGTG